MDDPRRDSSRDPKATAREAEVTLLSVARVGAGSASGGTRDPLDHLAEEFADRCRRGEDPSVAEYEARFPDQAEQVRRLLGAVAMMEQLRRGSQRARFLPERIGEFRILRELGRGGMGVVYEAVQESLWRHVAVKAIHHTQLDARRLQRFQREAQAVAQLHHTNIVPIFGVGEHDGIPYYAMQYIRGRGLDALIDSWRRDGWLPPAERWRIAARYAATAAEALGHAHEQGVLHRDVKPANLLIDEHDAVWVTDFGLAKMVGREELTASGDVIGTLRYLAPESLRGVSDGRSDVYSLGLTLYEMITLQPPFGDLTPSELLHRVSEGRPVRPREFEPTLPRDLETIVLTATAREPKDRYATGQALADDLQRFLDDRPILARRANVVERTYRWGRRNRGTAALASLAAAAVTLAAVAGWAGYVIKNNALAVQQEQLGRTQAAASQYSLVIVRLFSLLVPEEEGETDRDIPLTSALGHEAGMGGIPGMFAGLHVGPGLGPLGHGGPLVGFDAPPDGLFPGRHFFDGMGGPGGRRAIERQPEQLRKFLDDFLESYAPFVAENRDNAHVQRQAAETYSRIGLLYERLGRGGEAAAASEQALGLFDALAQLPTPRPADFARFLQLCGTINPFQETSKAASGVHRRLSRMEATLGRLLLASPGDLGYLRARVGLSARLGLIEYHLGLPGFDAHFRAAIAAAHDLVDRLPEEGFPHSDRSDALEAFALVLADRGDPAGARKHLEAAFADLEWVAADGLRSLPLAIRMESLADDFERLGEDRRSAEIQVRADQVDPRPPFADRPRPGRPFGRFRPEF